MEGATQRNALGPSRGPQKQQLGRAMFGRPASEYFPTLWLRIHRRHHGNDKTRNRTNEGSADF
jgi:hypothetical protein